MTRTTLKLASLLTILLASMAARAFAQTQEPKLNTREHYVLRAGDTISLDYRYTPEYNQTVTIQPDGFVNLLIVGDLRASGRTIDQVHAVVIERASTRLNQPELTITLKDFERPYIVVAGEVDKPGRFDFYEKTTALQAIMLAGGFKETAEQSTVYVFRKVNGDLAEVHKVNLHKIHGDRDLERDLVLQPGDMILVPINKLENISRFIKAANLGLYFNPQLY